MMKKMVGIMACMVALTVSAVSADTTNTTSLSPEAWVVSLGGVGQTVTTGDLPTAVGVDLSVGRTGHLLLPVEFGVRQSVAWDSEDSATFSTRLYSDFTLFTLAQETLDLFVGANVGVAYGDIQTQYSAAPEAGVRWWVKKDVAVLLRVEVPFRLNDTPEFTDTLKYFLGFQVRW